MAYVNKKILILALLLVFGLLSGNAVAKDEAYSGTYKVEGSSYQMIPNIMATLCQISGDEVVNDPSKIKKCLNKLTLKRRSSDAETAREGLREINKIKAEELQEMIALAVAKSSAVTNYYTKKSEDVAEANSNAKTANDQDGAAINTSAALTSVVNSLGHIYAEQLKHMVISDIVNVEKDTAENVASIEEIKEAQAQEEAKSGNASAASGTSSGSSSDSGNEAADEAPVKPKVNETAPTKEVTYAGNGICQTCYQAEGKEPQCTQAPCENGTYSDPKDNNITYICENGKCSKVNMAEESVVDEVPENKKTVAMDVISVEGYYVDKDFNNKPLREPYVTCVICGKPKNSFDDGCVGPGSCPAWIKPLVLEKSHNLKFNCSNGLCN